MSNRGVAYGVFDRKPSGKRRVGTPRRELQDNIKMNIQEWDRAWAVFVFLMITNGWLL